MFGVYYYRIDKTIRFINEYVARNGMSEDKIPDGSRLADILKLTALSLFGRVYKKARPDIQKILEIYGGSAEKISRYFRSIPRPDWDLAEDELILKAQFSHAVGGSYRREDWFSTELGTKINYKGIDAVLIAAQTTRYTDARSETNDYRYTIVVDEPEDIKDMKSIRRALGLAGYQTSIEVKSEKHNWLDSSELVVKSEEHNWLDDSDLVVV